MDLINKTFVGASSSTYKLTQLIDVGGMSRIYRGISKKNQQTYIIKLLNISKTESPLLIKKRLALEGLVSAKLNHPGICKTIDYVFDEEGNYGLVLENLIGNNLDVLIKKTRAPFSIKEALVIIFEILEALKYAHDSSNSKSKIVHRDIKPSNIFITDDFKIKLLDFGISNELGSDVQNYESNTGFTKCYSPPDLWINSKTFNHDGYNESHDIFCLGLIFFELITKEKAYKTQLENQVGHIRCLSEYGHTSLGIIEIFKKWTNLNPSLRFKSAQELIETLTTVEVSHERSKIKSLRNTKSLLGSTDFTEIDNELFKNFENGLSSIEYEVLLNLLSGSTKNLNYFCIDDEIKKIISKSGCRINIAFKHVKFVEILEFYKKSLSTKERYRVYTSLYNILQRTNDYQVHKYTHLIRNVFELDPFVCDIEKNCEGFQESLATSLFASLGFTDNLKVQKFIHNSIRLSKIENELFYVNALQFYKLYESNILSCADDLEKQIISYIFSSFAFTDSKIDFVEKKFLAEFNSKLNLKSIKFDLLISKDKDLLFTSLHENLRAYTLVMMFEFVLNKKDLSHKENNFVVNIFEQFISSTQETPLALKNSLFFLDFILVYWNELRLHDSLNQMLMKIITINIPDFGQKLVNLNHIRSIISGFPGRTYKELVTITTSFTDKKSEPIHISKDKHLTHLHLYYLFYREAYCTQNQTPLSQFITSTIETKKLSTSELSRDFDSVLSWKIPYFLFKTCISYSLIDNDFKEYMATYEFKRKIYAIIYELRINDRNYNFAQRMILCNYGIEF